MYPLSILILHYTFTAETLLRGGTHGSGCLDGHEVLQSHTQRCYISIIKRYENNHHKLIYLTNFQVAGTIVTYELILLQFNKADKVNDCYEH